MNVEVTFVKRQHTAMLVFTIAVSSLQAQQQPVPKDREQIDVL
jgi:hypothetical protein